MHPALRALPYVFCKKTPIPPYIIHFLTRRCNARCKHCFIPFNRSAVTDDRFCGEELSLAEIEKVTRSFKKRLIHANLTGGEIFLRDDIPEIVDLYVTNAGVSSLSLLTNGFFTGKIAACVDAILAKHPGLHLIVSVSVDDIGQRHDRFRQCPDLFTHVTETIHYLRGITASRFSWNINTCVTDENYTRLFDLYHELVARFGNIHMGACLVRGHDISGEILRNYTKFIDYLESQEVAAYGTIFKGVGLVNMKNRLVHRETLRVLNGEKFRASCVAGRLAFVIYPQGDVYPCEIRDWPLGNLREYDFDIAALTSASRAQQIGEAIRQTRCSCIHGCFLGMTILFSIPYYPFLAKEWGRKPVP